jgi:hypothetical protein
VAAVPHTLWPSDSTTNDRGRGGLRLANQVRRVASLVRMRLFSLSVHVIGRAGRIFQRDLFFVCVCYFRSKSVFFSPSR